ncbi:GvpL/GvpF family gas vesicle protein [Natronobeatus ordinarius]|uniref:GvpL/GvpF family gas vesicle protein n=1 Tax=Natronobeatus ordinarius TaxID=2963433 RepID=UPI0020CFDC40|nr:GvpL/GvpF family gas vesicle protein [Natronobeatus ordinarius]
MSNRYVYGVVDAGDAVEFETDAVAGAEAVYSIRHRRLAAVVSNVETTEPERTDEDATRHDEVLREIMAYDGGRTVVPMRFGMVFESDRALKNVLRGARPAFRRTMREIDGTVELGLKVVRDEDDDVDEATIREAVANELEAIAEASTENGLFSDRLVMNQSYLVPRDDRERFDETVAGLESAHEELTFRYTGPFAPYSFVDIHVGAQ